MRIIASSSTIGAHVSRGSWLSKLGTSCSAFARSCSSTICSITLLTFAVSYGGSQKAVLRSLTN